MGIIGRVGGFIGAHMAFIVPLCVAFGIAAPQALDPLKGAVPVLFAIITFQGSLNTTLHQVTDTFRHPRELLAILATTIVAVPVAARLAAGMVFADPQIQVGVVVEYSIPIAVTSFMWIDLFHGNVSLGLGAILTSTVLAPLTIPAAVQLLMGASVRVDALSMMGDLAFMVAVPAALGVALNEFTGGWGHEGLSPRLAPICRILTVVVIACNATGLSSYVLSLDPVVLEVALFIGVFATAGFLAGALVARALHAPMPDFLTICFCIGLRNISSGAVIVNAFFPGMAIVPVMMGTLFQQVLAGVAGSVLHHLTGEERERTRRRVVHARALMRYGRRDR